MFVRSKRQRLGSQGGVLLIAFKELAYSHSVIALQRTRIVTFVSTHIPIAELNRFPFSGTYSNNIFTAFNCKFGTSKRYIESPADILAWFLWWRHQWTGAVDWLLQGYAGEWRQWLICIVNLTQYLSVDFLSTLDTNSRARVSRSWSRRLSAQYETWPVSPFKADDWIDIHSIV